MKVPKSLFEEKFKERFSNFEAAPPSGAWAQIESILPGKTPWYKSIGRGMFLLVSVGLITTGLVLTSSSKVEKESVLASIPVDLAQLVSSTHVSLGHSRELTSLNSDVILPRNRSIRQGQSVSQLNVGSSRVETGEMQPIRDEVLRLNEEEVDIKTLPGIQSLNYTERQFEVTDEPHGLNVPKPVTYFKEPKVKLYASFRSFLQYNRLFPVIADQTILDGVINTPIEDKIGAQVSVGLRFQASDRLSFNLGAGFGRLRSRLIFSTRSVSPVDVRLVNVGGNLESQPVFEREAHDVSFEMSTIGLQAGMAYEFNNWDLSPKVELGLSWETSLNQAKFENNDRFKVHSPFFLEFKILPRFPLSNDWNARFGPTLSYAISQAVSGDSFDSKPYRFGLQLILERRD